MKPVLSGCAALAVLGLACTANVDVIHPAGAAPDGGTGGSSSSNTSGLAPGSSSQLATSNAPASSSAWASSAATSAASTSNGLTGIDVAPAACDFGHVVVGTTATCTVTITNHNADMPRMITGMAFTSESSSDFSAPPFLPPLAIPAGQSHTVSLTFSPSAVTLRTGAFEISDGTALTPHVVPVTGWGTSADDLVIVLTWNVEAADLDLHLVRRGGPAGLPFTNDDCYFQTCRNGAGAVNWGAVNPTLDIDDITGPGPENLSWRPPLAGEYEVGVHFFAGVTQPVTARVRVYQGDLPIADAERTLQACNEFWHVALLDISSTFAVTDLNTTAADTHGSCN
ncbi:MAG: choice-of-anchor D domain-containing protein [Deltaproteobacteria bacterium]|nr:choice-of-anchor D domain-containing protein [Deltaproteobacteria bacterium]